MGDLFAGLGALVVLAALVGGVPYALIRLAGPWLPSELPTLDLLTSQVGTSTVVAILVLLVWLAWLQFTACVIVEVYAGLRSVGMPARVPLSGGTQALANRLVSAVLVLFTVSAVVVPIAEFGAPPAAAPVASAPASATAPVVEERAPLVPVRKARKVYVVQPPHGRHHESLWEIADKCLGSGRRYMEIYELNRHKEQPDGSRLRIADLIRPGWVLDMPDDARNVHIVPESESRADVLKEHPGTPAELDGRTQAVTPGRDDPLTDPRAEARTDPRTGARVEARREAAPPAETSALPDGTARPDRTRREPAPLAPTAGPSREETAGAGHGRGAGVGEEPGHDAGFGTLDYLAGASLAAAGLLAALGRRRRTQLWNRAFGRRIVRPRDDAARAELALRLGADAPGSRMLDIGLRLLGRSLAELRRVPPTIYAAHLSPQRLDLWIRPSDPEAPAPWTAHDGGQVWRLEAHEGRMLDERALSEAPAPYPGLVSVGSSGEGRVLADLEAARGLIALKGARTTEALAALAVELATNRWSDRMRVTLVGFGEELTEIAPDRIRYVSGLAEILPELEREAGERGRAGEVLTGRIHGRAAAPAWPPHYVLSAIPPDPEEARRLAVLARKGEKGARTAAGYIVAGDVPHATWNWEITEEGRATIDALGVEAGAQLLPRRHYRALIDLFRTAGRLDGEPLSDVPGPPTAETPSIEVRILGPAEVVGPPRMEEGRAVLAVELVVYLATHPGGVHPVVLGGVLWPRGVQAVVRDATIARVGTWLGVDGSGRPNLSVDEAGRLRLGPEVRTDWAVFRDLVRRSRAGSSSGSTEDPALLEQALSLVRGPLLNGRPKGRYTWLAADDLEYDVTAAVADAAHRLCEIRLARGEAGRAVAAARAGLALAADDEVLWRDLLRATHLTGDPARLRAVAEALRRRAASQPGGGMAPETEALVDELLPTWRIRSAPSA
ncbi:hypothetical protein GCM10017673_40750 [Streptosporangium violaceochromogenes]|nr:hypothetical protein GCM10017673_40750 [Streptosporangium violaceochromogenes]